MCTKYISADSAAIESYWQVRPKQAWHSGAMYPRAPGPFIRAVSSCVAPVRECVLGQWGLIPFFATAAKLPYLTVNARSEELSEKPSYREPWARAQRCIVPAISFDEPSWETGRNVWWRFTRKDAMPWGLAGLWNTWLDRATGELHESYTMLTINADAHPLMGRMHKPDPKFGPDEQDKRSVVAIELDQADRWLYGTHKEVQELIVPPSMDIIEGTAVAAEPKSARPTGFKDGEFAFGED